MKLQFLYAPTADLQGSLALYRDALGWDEAWREGEGTVVLAIPGTEVQLMLDNNDPTAPFGPLFIVDSVQAFHDKLPAGLTVLEAPSEIPGGAMATYQDPGGTVVYVMDQSTDAETPDAEVTSVMPDR